jgi:hypothetical protein
VARSISPHQQGPVRVGPAFLSQLSQDCKCISAPPLAFSGRLREFSQQKNQQGNRERFGPQTVRSLYSSNMGTCR